MCVPKIQKKETVKLDTNTQTLPNVMHQNIIAKKFPDTFELSFSGPNHCVLNVILQVPVDITFGIFSTDFCQSLITFLFLNCLMCFP